MECLICYKENSTKFEENVPNLASISHLCCKLLEIPSSTFFAGHFSTFSICTGCNEKLMKVHHMMEELDEIQVKISEIKNEICQDLVKSEFCQAVGGHRSEIRTKIVEELCSRSRLSASAAKKDNDKVSVSEESGQNRLVVGAVNESQHEVVQKEIVMTMTKRVRKQKLKPLLVQQQNSPLIDLDSPTTVTTANNSLSSTSPRRSSRKRKSNIEDSDFIFDLKYFKTDPDRYTQSQLNWDGSNNQNEYVQLISSAEEEQISSLSDVMGFEVEGYNDHSYYNHNGIGKITQEESKSKSKRKYKRKSKASKKCNSDGLFQCDVCGVTYEKLTSWKTHRAIHLPKKFICSICDKAFSRKELLITHSFVHSEAQFDCLVCLKKFKTKKSLEVHTLIHKGIKKFKCECGKAFTQKINLITHQETHKPLGIKGYNCKICGKQFSTKEYLGYHVEGHVKRKNFTCSYSQCGRSFVKNYMLQSHMKSCHGSQKYSCQFCQLVVKNKHSFIRHLKKVHNNRKEIWNVEGYIETRYEPGNELKSENDFTSKVGNEMLMSEEISEIIPIEAVIENGEMSFLDNSELFSVSNNNVMILQMEGGGEIILNLDIIPTTTDIDNT